MLGWLGEGDGARVGPWVELGFAWFPWSDKGQRNLSRPARRRGLDATTAETRDGVTVLLACDRAGGVVSSARGKGLGLRVMKQDLSQALDGRLIGPPVLAAADGPFSAIAIYAESHGGRLASTRRTSDPLVHLRTVRAYRMRLHAWMRRFHGVATRYLPNYLQWHRLVDESVRNDPGTVAMRWPLDTGFG